MDSFTIQLTKAQLELVFAALVELPFKTSQPLIQAITQQVQKQAQHQAMLDQKAAAAAAPSVPPAPIAAAGE